MLGCDGDTRRDRNLLTVTVSTIASAASVVKIDLYLRRGDGGGDGAEGERADRAKRRHRTTRRGANIGMRGFSGLRDELGHLQCSIKCILRILKVFRGQLLAGETGDVLMSP